MTGPAAATGTVAAPVATEAQVRRLAQDWLPRARAGQVLAVQARPQWSGPERLEVGGQAVVRVVPCASPLAMRAALADRAEGERLVVLTDCGEEALGLGLLAHCAKQRPVSIEPWELVRAQFGVADLDPALVKEGRWLAEALIEHAPAHGWPPVTGTVLTRGHALRSLTAALLDVSTDDLDSAGVLQWTMRSADVVGFAALPARLSAGVAAWLGETAGPPARWTMACVSAGHGTDAVPLGLLARLLWAADVPVSTTVTAARVRIEQLLGGAQPSAAEAAAWGDAAHAWVERAVEGPDRQLATQLLGRAEEIARRVQAEALLARSDLLPAALTARLHGLADKLRAALARPGPAELSAVEAALRHLRRHRLAATGDRGALAEMAVRLLRWLAVPDPAEPATLAEAVARHVTADGWVDRARLDVWAGDPDPYVADAYRLLHEAVDARRAAHDRQFATLLAQATTADSTPGGMLRVEDVLTRVVRPVVDAGRRVLLLVVDGMGVAASTELVESVTGQGWVELTPAGGARVGVLAALPTVTQVSRASLFAGRVTTGGQDVETAGLKAALGPDAQLLHKARLRAGAGAGLDPAVVAALEDPRVRVVAAVVNTVDDALGCAEPGTAEWSTQTVPAVRNLLAHAKDRVVVLLSDHGHVVDRGAETELRAHPSGGARWRPADPPPGEGEQLFTGARVALGGGRVVLPWRETLRYTRGRAGYHGGASPAEAVIPLAVLSAGGDAAVPGWAGAPVAAPPWWREPVTAALAVTATLAAGGLAAGGLAPAGPGQDTLFDLVPATPPQVHAPVAAPSGAETPAGVPGSVAGGPAAAAPGGPGLPALVSALLASEVYRARHALMGRTTLPDARVAALLTALLAAGGRARVDSVAAAAGIPAHRIHLTITALRRLLQVEGYPVLDVDPDGQTVVLDERLLRDQFQLGS